MNVVSVFGGSGVIGRYVVREFAKTGARVRVAVRRPESAGFVKPMGDVGQVVPMAANIRDDASVAAAVDGADTVINCVGILFPEGKQTFDSLQAEGAGRVAAAATAAAWASSASRFASRTKSAKGWCGVRSKSSVPGLSTRPGCMMLLSRPGCTIWHLLIPRMKPLLALPTTKSL